MLDTLQFANVPSSIRLIPLGIVMGTKLVHISKAETPMLVTDEGIVKPVNLLQLKNALSPIVVQAVLSPLTVFSAVQWQKAESAIDLTPPQELIDCSLVQW